MRTLKTLWKMNLFLTKNLAHYNTDCLYEFYVYRIDVYDFSMYGFFKGGILFITFLFKNSKKNKNKLWHYADQNTDTHSPGPISFKLNEEVPRNFSDSSLTQQNSRVTPVTGSGFSR